MGNISVSIAFNRFDCWFLMKEVSCELKSRMLGIPVALSKHFAHFLNSLGCRIKACGSFSVIEMSFLVKQVIILLFLKLKLSLKENFRNKTLAPKIQWFKHFSCIKIFFSSKMLVSTSKTIQYVNPEDHKVSSSMFPLFVNRTCMVSDAVCCRKPVTDLSALKQARIKPRVDPVPIMQQGDDGDSSIDGSNDENDNDNVPGKTEDNKWDSYPCDVCGMAFRQRSHLATHKRKHMTERRFKCNDCGTCFKTKSSLHFHMKRHSEAPFVCGPCNKVYPERKQLMRHIRVVHTSVNRYPCDQCDKAFKTRQKHDLHYTLHTGEKPFICDLCQKAFVYKSTFVQHMNSHVANKEYKCDKCPKEYAVCAEFKRHYMNHTDFRPFKCTVCSKSFPLKGTLKNHMKIHAPEKPYKCSRCDKSFMKKQSLDCHMMLHEGQSPQFMCDQCSQSYYNVFALKRHYLKHTGERGFRCEVCHKAFWMKDALRVHMRTHSNVKMFPCKECHKAFAHKHTLDSHMKIHAGVASHVCHFCHKTFIHKANLTRHIRLHETNQITTHIVTR